MNLFDRLVHYRAALYVVAALGLVGLNGAFLYYALVYPEVMTAALANPIGLVFILEAFLMMGLLAWLVARLGFRKPGWAAFVVLSLVGSLAFSVPAFLLLHLRKRRALSAAA